MQKKVATNISLSSTFPPFDSLISEAERLIREFLSEDKDKITSNHALLPPSSISNQRTSLRDLLYKAILLDPLQASKQDLDTKLWRLVFYDPITEARRHARHSSKGMTNKMISGASTILGQRSASESTLFEASVLTRLINTGIGTYTLLLHNLLEGFKRGESPSLAVKERTILEQLLKTIEIRCEPDQNDQVLSPSSQSQHSLNIASINNDGHSEPLIRLMVYRLCLCLGDLFRYGAEAMQTPVMTFSRQSMSTSSLTPPLHNNYTPSVQVYQHAIRLCPSSGHGYNQMAVISGTGNTLPSTTEPASRTFSSVISTVYYYLAAISVKEPFVPVALRNLEVFIEKTGMGKSSQKKPVEDNFPIEQALLLLVKQCCFEASSESASNIDALEDKHLEALTQVDLLCFSVSLIMLTRLTKLVLSQQKVDDEEKSVGVAMEEDNRLKVIQQVAHQILKILIKNKTLFPQAEFAMFTPALVIGYLLFEISDEESRQLFASQAVHSNASTSSSLTPSLTISSILPSIDFYLLPLGYESEAQLIAQRAPHIIKKDERKVQAISEDEDDQVFDSQGSDSSLLHEEDLKDNNYDASTGNKKTAESSAPNPFITLNVSSAPSLVLGPSGASSASSITALLSSVIKNPISSVQSNSSSKLATAQGPPSTTPKLQTSVVTGVSSPLATPSQSFSIQPAQEGTKSPTPKSFKSTGSTASIGTKTTQPAKQLEQKSLTEAKYASPVTEQATRPFIPSSIFAPSLSSEVIDSQRVTPSPDSNIPLERLFSFSSAPTSSSSSNTEGNVTMLGSTLTKVDEQKSMANAKISEEQQSKFIEDLLASPTKKLPIQEKKTGAKTLSEGKPLVTQALEGVATGATKSKTSLKKEMIKPPVQTSSPNPINKSPKQASTGNETENASLGLPNSLEEMTRNPNFDPTTLLAGPIQNFTLAEISTQVPLLKDHPEHTITKPMPMERFKELIETNSDEIYYTPQFGPGSLFYTKPVKQPDGSMLHFHRLDLGNLPR